MYRCVCVYVCDVLNAILGAELRRSGYNFAEMVQANISSARKVSMRRQPRISRGIRHFTYPAATCIIIFV